MLPIESHLRVELLTNDRYREAHIANQHVRAFLGPKSSIIRTLLELGRRARPRVVPESSHCAVAEPTS
jgi:hypothetical protein